MKRKIYLLLFVLFALVCFWGCAKQSVIPDADPPGFWSGLFHGFILLFSFIASLFTDYTIYAFPNTGGWYNFGFLLGVMSFFGGGGAGARKRC
jgi:hypothetical protein